MERVSRSAAPAPDSSLRGQGFARSGRAVRLLLLFLHFFGLGSQLSSVSPYALANFGERGSLILVASQLAMPAGAFFAGWLSDRYQRLRVFTLIGLALAAPFQWLSFSTPESWTATLVSTACLRFLLSANFQWMSIAILESIGEASYSRVRSAGTVGFLTVQLVLFLLSSPGVAASFSSDSADTGRLGVFAYILCLWPALALPARRLSHEVYRFGDALRVMLQPRLATFLALGFAYHFVYQITDNYAGRYFEIAYGLNSVFLMWFVGVALEVPFLIFAPQLVERFGKRSLFFVSAAAGVTRFIALSASALGQEGAWILALQSVHSALFAGFYMAMIYYMRASVPPHLYGSASGIFSVLAQCLGGVLGNLACAALLHSSLGVQLYQRLSGVEVPAELAARAAFLPIFLGAALIFAALLPAFALLRRAEPPRAPEKRIPF